MPFPRPLINRVVPYLELKLLVNLANEHPWIAEIARHHATSVPYVAQVLDAPVVSLERSAEFMIHSIRISIAEYAYHRSVDSKWIEDLNKLFPSFRIFAGTGEIRLIVRKIVANHTQGTLPALEKYLYAYYNNNIPFSGASRSCNVLAFAIIHNVPAEYIQKLIQVGATLGERELRFMVDRCAIDPDYIQFFPDEFFAKDTSGLIFANVAGNHPEQAPAVFARSKGHITNSAEMLASMVRNTLRPPLALFKLVMENFPPGYETTLFIVTNKLMDGSDDDLEICKLMVDMGHYTQCTVDCIYQRIFGGHAPVDMLEFLYKKGLHPDRNTDPLERCIERCICAVSKNFEPVVQFVVDHYIDEINDDAKKRYFDLLSTNVVRKSLWSRQAAQGNIGAIKILLNKFKGVGEPVKPKYVYRIVTRMSIEDHIDLLCEFVDDGSDIFTNGTMVEIVTHMGWSQNELIGFCKKYEDKIKWDAYVEGNPSRSLFAVILGYHPDLFFEFMEQFPQVISAAHVAPEDSVHGYIHHCRGEGPSDRVLCWLDKMLAPGTPVDISRWPKNICELHHSILLELLLWGIYPRYPHLHDSINWLELDKHGRTVGHVLLQYIPDYIETVSFVLQKQIEAGWCINQTTRSLRDDYTVGHTLARMPLPEGWLTEFIRRFPQIDFDVISSSEHDTPWRIAIRCYEYGSKPFLKDLIKSGKVNLYRSHSLIGGRNMIEYARDMLDDENFREFMDVVREQAGQGDPSGDFFGADDKKKRRQRRKRKT